MSGNTAYDLIRFIKIIADAGNIDAILKQNEKAAAIASEKFLAAKQTLAEAGKIASAGNAMMADAEKKENKLADERAAFENERDAGLKDIQNQYEVVATLNAQAAETKSALDVALEEAHNKSVKLEKLVASAEADNVAAAALKADYEARLEKLNAAIAG